MNYLPHLAISNYLFVTVLCITIVICFCLLYLLFRLLRNSKNIEFPVRQNEQGSHTAIFVDLSPKATDIVELAVEVWRIKNRINKVGINLNEIQKRGIESSLQKFSKFLEKYEINIIDHTGEKYNEGMNVDVISFEKDENIKTPMVEETIEPSITCKGHVIKKGKIIVINK